MEPSIEQDKGDPGDLRLRRFTMGMGVVFFILICGGAHLGSGNLPLGQGTLAITVKSPNLIRSVIYLVTLYALGLFLYRKCYLQAIPYEIRRWLQAYGVIVEYIDAKQQSENGGAKRDLHFHNLLKGSNPSFNLEEVSKTVPSQYYSKFLITLDTKYHDAENPTCNQVKTQVLGVKEEGGIPIELCGLSITNADDEINRLEQIIRNGVEPKIAGHEFHTINSSNGKPILILRLPSSWTKPHV